VNGRGHCRCINTAKVTVVSGTKNVKGPYIVQEGKMPGTWDAKKYRGLAARWREEAETLPPGRNRDACMTLADGYADLASIIEKEGLGADHYHLRPGG
jgi:hypothetical protein